LGLLAFKQARQDFGLEIQYGKVFSEVQISRRTAYTKQCLALGMGRL